MRSVLHFVRSLHEEHGVIFHLEDTAITIDARQVTLKSGGRIDAETVFRVTLSLLGADFATLTTVDSLAA